MLKEFDFPRKIKRKGGDKVTVAKELLRTATGLGN